MINSRHLPLGQGIPLDTGRRRSYHPHQYQHQYQQYPQQPVYTNYVQPYGANYYSQSVPSQYHNSQTSIPHLQTQPLIRSPPTQQYIPPLHQQSPAHYTHPTQSYVATQLHPTNNPQSQTSASSQSSHSSNTISASLASTTSQKNSNALESYVKPFKPPLPWYSRPDLDWPKRRNRKKRRPVLQIHSETKNLSPNAQTCDSKASTLPNNKGPSLDFSETSPPDFKVSEKHISNNFAQVYISPDVTSSESILDKKVNQKLNVPMLSIVPALPRSIPRQVNSPASLNGPSKRKSDQNEGLLQANTAGVENSHQSNSSAPKESNSTPTKAWATPRTWAGIFYPEETTSTRESREAPLKRNVSASKSTSETSSLAGHLKSFDASSGESNLTFLEPRGLVNAGNMCYMNSILQVLVFCTLFFDFLDQVSKRAVYSFKSTTPLLDAMILFMREYSVIHKAKSADQLRMKLKEGDQVKYGEPFTPDYIYNVINYLPRFSSMRSGHQQDAEEFLGFLLEGLHDECIQVIESVPTDLNLTPISPDTSVSAPSTNTIEEKAWLEVGPKQKAVITRSSGITTTETPVTKIFGGNLRSELRVPGLRESVTMEPYQSLLLDIGAPQVSNIIDALKGLNRSELLHGDFKSPKGHNVTATKQVFIETLPPVLILHLKRFQYDNTGGTQKIWKKIGYPLELELPKEVFPRQKRLAYGKNGFPKYELISVVYHHGKNASVGHYTVDVRRQDGREWIRLDDTAITRIRSEDVAEGGSEEDSKFFSTTDSRKKTEIESNTDRIANSSSDNDRELNGWKQASNMGKKWPNSKNGNSGHETKSEKFSMKDNKVAYLLFYQKI
ncbi:Ubiquitin carboxyl-terminal hydrolase 21 [Erysiphe neolycopersici]|uniref:Ubiquitin carboxyl-terminal hydrolase n=1 Tax=Erysiphe neolycopersici TaxID=212602 RepID=A0A420HTQ1_9PEZI|nr:Ubiquitin carboxyl-terminal hydrolase 21 [Erysiphe neolycopersici]